MASVSAAVFLPHQDLPRAACAQHGAVAAAGACIRCGDFACEACLGGAARVAERICVDCRAAGTRAEQERRIRRLRVESGIASAVVGVFVAIFMWLVVASGLESARLGVVESLLIPFGSGALFGVPFWLAAMVTFGPWRSWTPLLALLSQAAGLWWWAAVMRGESRVVPWLALAAGLYAVVTALRLHLARRSARVAA